MVCGWEGLGNEASEGDLEDNQMYLNCPECENDRIGVVLYPNWEEIKEFGTEEEIKNGMIKQQIEVFETKLEVEMKKNPSADWDYRFIKEDGKFFPQYRLDTIEMQREREEEKKRKRKSIEIEEERHWGDHLTGIGILHDLNIEVTVLQFVNDLLQNELGSYLEKRAKVKREIVLQPKDPIHTRIRDFIKENKPGNLLTKYFSEKGLKFQQPIYEVNGHFHPFFKFSW